MVCQLVNIPIEEEFRLPLDADRDGLLELVQSKQPVTQKGRSRLWKANGLRLVKILGIYGCITSVGGAMIGMIEG